MWLLDLLFPPRSDERIAREISADDFLALLSPTLVTSTSPATTALLPFSRPEVRAVIHEAKYHGSEHSFELLALALSEYLQDADEVGRAPIFIPIPLGASRRAERGFNQGEEMLARTKIGEVDVTLLVRTRETVSQVSLARAAREENMRGAFSAAHPLDSSRTYIIVDDVVTTGATLQAAIDALTSAGAKHILPLALAH